MHYTIERYCDCERFNAQYQEIYQFLLRAEKLEYNEHFHWGRFEWMHRHSYLDVDKLTNIVMFRDADGEIVGLITYDTSYDDRTYLIHTSNDAELLNIMIDTVLAGEESKATIKVNSKDDALCAVLRERQFKRAHRDNTVLALDLSRELEYSVSGDYSISQPGFDVDDWQYQLVIHKGFDNEGIPEKWADEILAPTPNENADLKIFALQSGEYCAHCGLWYTEGDTAYVEPVVTVLQHRGQGLARAVVYEACNRARKLGAKRATVLSDQEFYYRIGFECSSEIYCWEKVVDNGVQLLRAEESDAETVRAMQQVAFAELLEKYQDYDMSPATESLEKIRWKISHPGSFYYFILAGSQTVGGIRVVDAGDGGPKRISPLFILPQYRGKGYAQAAILEAEKRHGSHNWELGTILQETGNCYLYEKMGYRQTSRQTVINVKMTIVGYEKD